MLAWAIVKPELIDVKNALLYSIPLKYGYGGFDEVIFNYNIKWENKYLIL